MGYDFDMSLAQGRNSSAATRTLTHNRGSDMSNGNLGVVVSEFAMMGGRVLVATEIKKRVCMCETGLSRL